MAATLPASISEPLCLYTSLIQALGQGAITAFPAHPQHNINVHCEHLKNALQAQLQTLASFAQSAAKEALELTET